MATRRGQGDLVRRKGHQLVLRALSRIADTSWVTPKGRIAVIAACALACCLMLASWLVVRDADGSAQAASSVLIQRQQWGPAAPGAQAPSGRHAPGGVRIKVLVVTAPLAACEARIEREPGRLPTMAVVGASYTAGTGPNNQLQSWAVVLAQQLHWNAVIDGVPGAGYVSTGDGGHGPMARMLRAEGLSALAPSVVIVQAGHDDLGVPPASEEAGVRATLGLIHLAAPEAQVALLTVFARSLDGTQALRQTDHVIVTSAKAADPRVIVMDPLAGQWRFQHANGGLHPTAAGDAWIAHEVLTLLQAHGVRAATGTNAPQPIICDSSVGVRHAGTSA
jgi:acyl-CoA thioesterase I